MKNITLALLAAATIGAVSIGGASAMPFNNTSAALGESHVQDVRVVCDQSGRCYNTRRAYRSSRFYDAPRYYDRPDYYNGPRYRAAPNYGYYDGPRVGIGIGPFGLGVY